MYIFFIYCFHTDMKSTVQQSWCLKVHYYAAYMYQIYRHVYCLLSTQINIP